MLHALVAQVGLQARPVGDGVVVVAEAPVSSDNRPSDGLFGPCDPFLGNYQKGDASGRPLCQRNAFTCRLAESVEVALHVLSARTEAAPVRGERRRAPYDVRGTTPRQKRGTLSDLLNEICSKLLTNEQLSARQMRELRVQRADPPPCLIALAQYPYR
jgi:hypothetical protein